MHIPSLGGVTDWLDTEALGAAELHRFRSVSQRARPHGC
jgi:hypothetical protein